MHSECSVNVSSRVALWVLIASVVSAVKQQYTTDVMSVHWSVQLLHCCVAFHGNVTLLSSVMQELLVML